MKVCRSCAEVELVDTAGDDGLCDVCRLAFPKRCVPQVRSIAAIRITDLNGAAEYMPAGWVRDPREACWRGPNGEVITDYELKSGGRR